MSTALKNKILKPFLRFTKNLLPNQLHLSLLRGICELESLELEENALMELLELPTWLLLKRASCTGVIAKIIEQVNIELQALDEPRPLLTGNIPKYRMAGGKYGFSDKVMDGVTVQINTIHISFNAQAFHSSIEFSRILVMSKTPTWKVDNLNMTNLMLPDYDSILIFKEISWESVRFVANGLLSELQGMPVKLIANRGRLRLTLKKRLSDSVLLNSRINLLLDDLLWILTLSQLEAAIVFARSLEQSIRLTSQQSKQFEAEMAKRQFSCSKQSNPMTNSVNNSNSNNNTNNSFPIGSKKFSFNDPTKHYIPVANTNADNNHANQNLNNFNDVKLSNAIKIFHEFDVLETSYHLTISRTELHFCDESMDKLEMIHNVCNGSIRVNMVEICCDWYPYHVEKSKILWNNCQLFKESLTNWLNSLPSVHFKNVKEFLNSESPTFNNESNLNGLNHSSISQSVLLVRVMDISASKVAYADRTKPGKQNSCKSPGVPNSIKQELPFSQDFFVGSDKKLHNLSSKDWFVAFEFKYFYQSNRNNLENDLALPFIIFGQLNPFYLSFDTDTIVWLYVFFLTLQQNLASFMNNLATNNSKLFKILDINHCHIRIESLMPRIIMPLHSSPLIKCCPDALIIHADQIIVQSVAQPIPQSLSSVLISVLQELYKNSKKIDELAKHSNNSSSSDNSNLQPESHPVFDQKKLDESDCRISWTKFFRLAHSCSDRHFEFDAETQKASVDQFWLISCPNIWIEFLTVINEKLLNYSKIHRQSILDPCPLHCWLLMTIPFTAPLEFLLCPSQIFTGTLQTNYNMTKSSEPIQINLGLINVNQLPSLDQFEYPNIIDHIVCLRDLFQELIYLKTCINLINYEYKLPYVTNSPSYMPMSFNLAFSVQRPVLLKLNLTSSSVLSSTSPNCLDTDKTSSKTKVSPEWNRCKSNTDNSTATFFLFNDLSNSCLNVNETAATTPLSAHSTASTAFRKSNSSICEESPSKFNSSIMNSFEQLSENYYLDQNSLSSLSDNNSLSGDLSETMSVTGLSDDWFKPYQSFNQTVEDCSDRVFQFLKHNSYKSINANEDDGPITKTPIASSIDSGLITTSKTTNASNNGLDVEEIGSDVFELNYLISDRSQTPTICSIHNFKTDFEPDLFQFTNKSSVIKSGSSICGDPRPIFNSEQYSSSPGPISTKNKPEYSALTIRLNGIYGEGVMTNVQSNMWLFLKSVDLIGPTNNTATTATTATNNDHVAESIPNAADLWSIDVKVHGDQNLDVNKSINTNYGSFINGTSSPITKNNDNNNIFLSRITVNINLLQNWHLIIPSSMHSLLLELWQLITDRGSLNSLLDTNKDNNNKDDNNNNNNNFIVKSDINSATEDGAINQCDDAASIHPASRLPSNKSNNNNNPYHSVSHNDIPASVLSVRLYLQNGNFSLDISEVDNNSVDLLESGTTTFVYKRKLVLDKGLTLSLIDGYLRMSTNQNVVQKSQMTTSSESVTRNNSFGNNNVLINKYASENKLLKDEVKLLTREIEKLKMQLSSSTTTTSKCDDFQGRINETDD